MKINLISKRLEKALGIDLHKPGHDLGVLQRFYEEIVGEPWFEQTQKESFAAYVRERFVNSNMDERQLNSILVAYAKRFHAKQEGTGTSTTPSRSPPA